MTSLLIKLAIVVAAIAALIGMKTLYDNHQQSIGAAAQYKIDQADMDKQKREAAAKLDMLQKEKDAADQALATFKSKMDIQYVKSQKQLAALADNLRDLGQLRDPYAQAGGCGSGSGSAETKEAGSPALRFDNGTKTSGLLSTELTRFLHTKDADADAINVAYSDCRAALQNLQASPAFLQ